MRTTKKILSMILAIVMVLGLLPATAFASENNVYISVSFDGQYIDDKNGNPIAYIPVSFAELASIDLDAYGLSDYKYDEDGDGTYDITALHMVIYAHENIYGGDFGDVTFTGGPGSSYFQGGIFGFDENLNYYRNGEYPLARAGWGATSDQIVLEPGDFLDVASFSSWDFYMDSNYGFHFFADEGGEFAHDYTAEAGTAAAVKLVRSYSGMGTGAAVYDEPGYEISYGTALYDASGTVTTDDSGCAEITFPSAGTWYLWADGGYGSEYPDVIVNSPAYAKVTVTAAPEQPREAQSVTTQLNATMAKLASTVTEPVFGTTAGEWTVLSLARGNYYAKDNAYFTDYYDRIVQSVNTTAASVNMNGALHKNKSTENSRLIVALSALGKDATSVGDWNLVEAYSANGFSWIKKQGLNGTIWALIALDSNNYETSDTTILLTEHRLEEAFPFATRVIVMNEGAILCDDKPENVGLQLKDKGSGMFLAMPTAMRVWAAVETKLDCPMTVRDGSSFLSQRAEEQALLPLAEKDPPVYPEDVTLECENLWFRYEKEACDVVKGFSLKLRKGEFYAILGGNGAGKSTTLKVISGLRCAYRGDVRLQGKLGHLPQNPQTLFVKRTVREDLYEVFRGEKIPKEQQDAEVARITELCGLREFLDRHPYDISGGEQQRTALAKVLLTAPDILLLDEPTKGFDAEFKVTFSLILRRLVAQGVTILMVSHDVPFCAEFSHKCGLFFDGSIVAEGTPREFFSGNSFYTTPANRMARHLIPNAVTVADIIGCCGGELPTEPEIPEATVLPEPKETAVNFKPKPLPVWRKLLAGVSLAIAMLVFFYATSITDLSALIGKDGISASGEQQLLLYLVLIAALGIFLAAIGRRSAPSAMLQIPAKQRTLSKRTTVATVLILLFIPLTIFAGVMYLGNQHYNVTALLVLMECMIPFFLVFESRKPKARELVTIAVLCAIGVAGRSAFFMLPQFKPVLALVIISGVAFGGETGFLVGAVTMMVSNVLFSQGPWMPWQMFSMGIIGFLAGVLFRKGLLRRSRGSLATFGAFSAVIIYGGIMNPAAALMYNSQTLNWEMLKAYYVSGLPMDLIHAAATVIFIFLAAEPMLEKLDRIKVKYGLVE